MRAPYFGARVDLGDVGIGLAVPRPIELGDWVTVDGSWIGELQSFGFQGEDPARCDLRTSASVSYTMQSGQRGVTKELPYRKLRRPTRDECNAYAERMGWT